MSLLTRMISPSAISSGAVEAGAGVPAPLVFFSWPVSSGLCLGGGNSAGFKTSLRSDGVAAAAETVRVD